MLGQLGVGVGFFLALLLVGAKTARQRRARLIVVPTAYLLLFTALISFGSIGWFCVMSAMYGPVDVATGKVVVVESTRGTDPHVLMSNGDRFDGARHTLLDVGHSVCFLAAGGVFMIAATNVFRRLPRFQVRVKRLLHDAFGAD